MRALALFLAFPLLLQPAPSPQQMFDRVRERVAEQLKRTSNYSCVLTIDRENFSSLVPRDCESETKADERRLQMRDRLRLDVAVSGGNEMFSWHGGKAFSSKGIEDVVNSGAISSGSFVGYLQNIFFKGGGVRVRYRIAAGKDQLLHFEYDVPLSASEYRLSLHSTRTLTPFHGEFSADPATFELVRLTAIVDRAPKRSDICFAKSEVEYQTVTIAAYPVRVPAVYSLEMREQDSSFTNRSTYQACQAFTGESTIDFGSAAGSAATSGQTSQEISLPRGLRLSVTLHSPVDDLHSMTGDVLQGVLSRAINIRRKNISIPAGAEVSGVVTRLETYYQPFHYELGIRFDRVNTGRSSYTVSAVPAYQEEGKLKLRTLFGGRFPPNLEQAIKHGILLKTDPHFRIAAGTVLELVTE